MSEGTRITCTDVSSGESDSAVIKDNWMIVTDGECEVTSEQLYANGTAVVTIKRGKSLQEHKDARASLPGTGDKE